MHKPIETKTPHHAHRQKSAVTTQRPQNWRPQQVGLSRDEIRRIVLDQLG